MKRILRQLFASFITVACISLAISISLTTSIRSSQTSTKGNIDNIIMPLQGHISVSCSRDFDCDGRQCMSIDMKRYLQQQASSSSYSCTYQDIQSCFKSNLLKSSNSNNNATNATIIHYWGDSIQATMECDMRQVSILFFCKYDKI